MRGSMKRLGTPAACQMRSDAAEISSTPLVFIRLARTGVRPMLDIGSVFRRKLLETISALNQRGPSPRWKKSCGATKIDRPWSAR